MGKTYSKRDVYGRDRDSSWAREQDRRKEHRAQKRNVQELEIRTTIRREDNEED